MGQTLIEKIIGRHTEQAVSPGQIVDVAIDVRAARDFGGANVVKNLQNAGLSVADPARTLFTFDCNPGGSDQGYAANQQFCRSYAREHGIGLRDITQGIGTHIAIEDGLVGPGTTFVSTDSHANILGAIGAFGQGMGDQDIAAAWASGKVWFKVPPTVKVTLRGRPGPEATAKDLTLALTRHFGARGLLGCVAELYGEVVDGLGVAERITIASMATEMGAIVALLTPNQAVLDYCAEAAGRSFEPIAADPDAVYVESVEVDIEGLTPLIARPGHPDDVVPVADMADERVDSIFIGSCTNGQLEDLRTAARILDGRQVADTVILKVVPSTWDETHVLDGAIGEYVVIARRSGDDWFVGAMTDQPRTLEIPLGVLGEGSFEATIYADTAQSHETPTKLGISNRTVKATDSLTVKLAPGGGAAIRLKR